LSDWELKDCELVFPFGDIDQRPGVLNCYQLKTILLVVTCPLEF
jgi:hypothetical protein